MSDDLDLSGVHGHHEPDPTFRLELRRQLETIVRAPIAPTSSATSADVPDPEEDLIMLDTEDRPIGLERGTPDRRPPGRWLLVAAAAAVVAVAGAALVAASGDDEEPLDTATSVPTTAPLQNMMELEGFVDLEPGRYFVDPDGDPTTPLRVTYQIAAEGWSQWLGGVKDSPTTGHTGFSITTVTNVNSDACQNIPADPPVGPTVDDLATALSQLAPFDVTAPPTDVTLFGYQGKHLELTVPDLPRTQNGFTGCVDGNLHTWIAPLVGGAFYGYTAEPGETEEFWILDVEGTRLVLIKDTHPSSPAQDVAERDAIFDTFNIEP